MPDPELPPAGDVAVIIPAAGYGTRLRAGGRGGDSPKALRVLAGRSLLQRSVDALAPYAARIVICAPEELLDEVAADGGQSQLVVVAGGASRQESVRSGLAAVGDDARWVLVHDAARPLVPAAVVRRVLDALWRGADVVVPAMASPDSLRRVHPDGGSAPLDRAAVRLVQTPQGFTLSALRDGHEGAGDELATDDATLVEATGRTVVLVAGDPLAFKITTPSDLVIAEALLRG